MLPKLVLSFTLLEEINISHLMMRDTDTVKTDKKKFGDEQTNIWTDQQVKSDM